MRLFVALDVPAAVRERVSRSVAPLRGERSVRWTAAETWHVTLAFLGEVDVPLDAVTDAVASAVDGAGVGGIGLRLGGAGHFGQRVLWLGVEDDPPGAVGTLGEAVQQRLADASLPVDRKPVRAHLTLARVRRRGQKLPPGLVASVPRVEADWHVGEVVVYESVVGAGPARHDAVARVPLRH